MTNAAAGRSRTAALPAVRSAVRTASQPAAHAVSAGSPGTCLLRASADAGAARTTSLHSPSCRTHPGRYHRVLSERGSHCRRYARHRRADGLRVSTSPPLTPHSISSVTDPISYNAMPDKYGKAGRHPDLLARPGGNRNIAGYGAADGQTLPRTTLCFAVVWSPDAWAHGKDRHSSRGLPPIPQGGVIRRRRSGSRFQLRFRNQVQADCSVGLASRRAVASTGSRHPTAGSP